MTEEKFAELTVNIWREHQRALRLKQLLAAREILYTPWGMKLLAFKKKRYWDAFVKVTNRVCRYQDQLAEALRKGMTAAPRELSGR